MWKEDLHELTPVSGIFLFRFSGGVFCIFNLMCIRMVILSGVDLTDKYWRELVNPPPSVLQPVYIQLGAYSNSVDPVQPLDFVP